MAEHQHHSPHALQPPNPVGRRAFLDMVLTGSATLVAASMVYPVWKYLVPPKRGEAAPNNVLAAKTEDLPPNSGKVFPFGRKPAIVIRTPGGDIRAFTAICTHLGCTVQYRPDLQHIWCACHNGHYDLLGRNISGPPPRPLERYEVHVQGDKIFVSRQKA